MDYLLILLADVGYTFKSSATRIYQNRIPEQEKELRLYQLLYTAAAGLLFFWQAGFHITFTPLLTVIGTVYGLGVFTLECTWARALELGSMMLSSIIFNTSLLIPVLFSAVINGEGITVLQMVGLVLILATMMLSSLEGGQKQEGKKVSLLWFVMALGTFISNGAVATLQKVYALQCGEDTMMEFMAFSFAVATVLFTLSYLLQKKGRKLTGSYPFLKRYGTITLLAFGAGASGMVADGILGALCVRVPGAVLYPCINGGLSVLLTVSSILFFKEKPTVQKLLAVLCGTVAIVVLNL